jgi:phosphoribosyl-ATP pyrophosphohydrolase
MKTTTNKNLANMKKQATAELYSKLAQKVLLISEEACELITILTKLFEEDEELLEALNEARRIKFKTENSLF